MSSDAPRLLIVVPALAVGGTEQHIALTMPELAKAGQAITIFTTRCAAELDDTLRRRGIPVVNTPRNRWIPGPLAAAFGLIREIRRFRPDAIHFFLPEAYLIGAICAILMRVPCRIMSRRSLNRYQTHKYFTSRLERWLHRSMTRLIGNSQAVTRELLEEGADRSRVLTIHNGVRIDEAPSNDEIAKTRRALDLPQNGPLLAIVANLIPYKGHVDLIEALRLANPNLPKNWRLLVIGRDDGAGTDLKNRATRAGIGENVLFMGQRSDVAVLLRMADIGILSSHEEGFSNAVLEAMAAGLPLIVTDVGGNAEAVVHGENGLVVPPRNPTALAEAIRTLTNDPETCKRFGRAGRIRCEERFAQDKCIRQYRELYAGLPRRTLAPDGASKLYAMFAGLADRIGGGLGFSRWRRLSIRASFSVLLLGAVAWLVISNTGAASLRQAVSGLTPGAVLLALAALMCSALLASWRVKLVADDLGYRLSWHDALAALGVGQLGSVLFFQVFGQLAARGAFLSQRGLSVGASMLMVGYERVLGLVVSLVMAAFGAWYLFGRIALNIEGGGDQLVKLVAGILLAVVVSARAGWGRMLVDAGAALLGTGPVHRLARSGLLSIAIQLLTASAFVTLGHALAPDVAIVDLAAASVVVMFAAAMPVSLAGWGVRELGAVVALGAVGVPPSIAFVTAATIGVGSLLVVLPLSALALTGSGSAPMPVDTANTRRIDYSSLVSIALPLVVAVAVFFHIHVPTEAGGLNVNLADPFALIGGVLFLILCADRRQRSPMWRMSHVRLHVVGASLLFTAALFVGAWRFGWTDWALANKYAGWYMLLAYGATGALLVTRLADDRRRLLLTTFVAAGLAIAGLELGLITLRSVGVVLSPDVLWYNATGFAANRNAFAFQLLMVIAATLVLGLRAPVKIFALAIGLTALWFAGSRAGWGAATLLLVLAVWIESLNIRHLAIVVAVAAAMILSIQYAWLLPLGETGIPVSPTLALYDDSTMVERLKSYKGALQLIAEYPLFGAGLGSFIESELRATGVPLVIHSTPLWIAAEMGLIGILVLLTPIMRIVGREIRRVRHDPAACLLMLLITAFATMSLVHEMLYQRTFWLLLGAGLAWPAAASASARRGQV